MYNLGGGKENSCSVLEAFRLVEGLTGRPQRFTHVAENRDEVKWVREKAYLEFDEAGELLGGFGIAQDITESKMAEALIAAQRDLARSIGSFNTVEPALQFILDTVLELGGLDAHHLDDRGTGLDVLAELHR